MISDTIQRGSSAYFRRRLERKGIALDKLHAAIFMRPGCQTDQQYHLAAQPPQHGRPTTRRRAQIHDGCDG
jgi:hypothetical protein